MAQVLPDENVNNKDKLNAKQKDIAKGIPALMSNGFTNATLHKAVGYHDNTICYPDIDTCIGITIAFEIGVAGLHLFRNNMDMHIAGALQALLEVSSKCSGKVTHVLIVGNIDQWSKKYHFHNYSLVPKLTSKIIQEELMEAFSIENPKIITTTTIKNHVEVVKGKDGVLKAANYDK